MKEGFVKQEYDGGFVRREESAGLAQSEDCKQPEEISLIHRIDNSTKDLLESLRNIESLSEDINERLLPPKDTLKKESNIAEQAPNGWLECHLADLQLANHKAIKIFTKLGILNRETQIKVS